jgi:hypothetical protein
VKTRAHTARGNNPQARGMLRTADVAKPRANDTGKQAAETNCLEYHMALNKWNRILRKILIEKKITFK